MTSLHTTDKSARGGIPRKLVLGIVVCLSVVLAGAIGLFAGPSANAATAPGNGWVRVGHLSPDTKSVDVRLTKFSGGQTVYELDNVTYGQVSPYKQLPAGRYAVSMTAAGAAATSKPIIGASITVAAGKPITVVAYGKNDALKTTVFEDDLTPAAANSSRVRLVQAATVSKTVDVQTSTGTVIAKDASYGSASGYAAVGSGSWTLDLTGRDKNTEGTAKLQLASGSINTLFVLDNSKGGITVVPVVDSAATQATPKGGVQTGGGYEALHPGADVTWFGGYAAFEGQR